MRVDYYLSSPACNCIFNFKVQNKLDKTSFKILFEGWINRILVSILKKYVIFSF